MASSVPDRLTLKRNRDLEGRRDLIGRRIAATLLFALLALGAVNLFGQRPGTSTSSGTAGSVAVYAPARVRGGLIFEARFHIRATQELKDAQLVLGSGWAEGITINTIEPTPVGEASRDGKLVLDLGHVPQGQSHLLFVQMQVNPTNIGRREQDVDLYDGETPIAHLDRTITIFP